MIHSMEAVITLFETHMEVNGPCLQLVSVVNLSSYKVKIKTLLILPYHYLFLPISSLVFQNN